MPTLDYLIVGAGPFGATFAHLATRAGRRCLVIDKRPHIGGNCYTSPVEGINVHRYGPHIFHTSSKRVWDFVSSFVEFNRFTYSPVANYKGQLFNLPFNMNTFYQLWGATTPAEAKRIIEEQKRAHAIGEPANLEEQAISLVGPDVYTRLIKGYTEKQWGRAATEIPAFVIRRLPVRFTFDNNYFDDAYQGIPIGGYTRIFERLLEGVEVRLGVDYFADRARFDALATRLVFTGKIDEFFGYRFGELEYRSLRFEHELMPIENFQGNAGVNYTDREVPYTRIIEHKHFEFGRQPVTYVTKEYALEAAFGVEPYYPINDARNQRSYEQYRALADQLPNVIFGGRLAEYRYYDMHQVFERVLDLF